MAQRLLIEVVTPGAPRQATAGENFLVAPQTQRIVASADQVASLIAPKVSSTMVLCAYSPVSSPGIGWGGMNHFCLPTMQPDSNAAGLDPFIDFYNPLGSAYTLVVGQLLSMQYKVLVDALVASIAARIRPGSLFRVMEFGAAPLGSDFVDVVFLPDGTVLAEQGGARPAFTGDAQLVPLEYADVSCAMPLEARMAMQTNAIVWDPVDTSTSTTRLISSGGPQTHTTYGAVPAESAGAQVAGAVAEGCLIGCCYVCIEITCQVMCAAICGGR